jgi:hypothetical protein
VRPIEAPTDAGDLDDVPELGLSEDVFAGEGMQANPGSEPEPEPETETETETTPEPHSEPPPENGFGASQPAESEALAPHSQSSASDPPA